MTNAEIEKHARLCAQHGDENDCLFNSGTPGYAVWMTSYDEELSNMSKRLDSEYEAAMEREEVRLGIDDESEQLRDLERGYTQDRYSRR